MFGVVESTFELIVEDIEDPEVQCESVLHREQGLPPHPADWYASSPCGGVFAVCEARRVQCRHEGCWRCVTNCTSRHPYEHIEFTPVKS